MKLKILIELQYDEEFMHGNKPEGILWFNEEVLGGGLSLFSEEIGDFIGEVRVL
jgi:hypothetical protein